MILYSPRQFYALCSSSMIPKYFHSAKNLRKRWIALGDAVLTPFTYNKVGSGAMQRPEECVSAPHLMNHGLAFYVPAHIDIRLSMIGAGSDTNLNIDKGEERKERGKKVPSAAIVEVAELTPHDF
ncbi:hypothetical protein EAF04_003498 [Stromatinia cepivora]|nr:hypothetical protein EAF04_003498 [Stromatinia cepivora]